MRLVAIVSALSCSILGAVCFFFTEGNLNFPLTNVFQNQLQLSAYTHSVTARVGEDDEFRPFPDLSDAPPILRRGKRRHLALLNATVLEVPLKEQCPSRVFPSTFATKSLARQCELLVV